MRISIDGAPVVGFGAAGAGIDGEDGAEVVALRAQHVLDFEVFDLRAGLPVRFVDLGPLRVQFLQDFQVFDRRLRAVESAHPGLHPAQGFQERLGLLGIVPEIGGLALLLLFLHLRAPVVDLETFAEGLQTLLQIFDLFLRNHNSQI